MNAETTASTAANFILSEAHRRGIKMTNLKLQKLLYYAQAWHLAIIDKPLFPERIEAWVHGPVVPPVFGSFKHHRWNPIPDPGNVSIPAGDQRWPLAHHIGEVMDTYGNLSGSQLETLTHTEDPWRLARKGIPADQSSNEIISVQAMIDYYRPKVRQVSA